MLANLLPPGGYAIVGSLNGKYIKSIATAATEPNVDIGSATHTHTSDGGHGHAATVPAHTHTSGISSAGGNVGTNTAPLGAVAPLNHTHGTSTESLALAEASTDGAHTHDAFTNDITHRTISFHKRVTAIINMSRKSLPRNIMFFYSKTGVLPKGLIENLDYDQRFVKGSATPGTNAGTDEHQHNTAVHNHLSP
jgi:hypothetical protein